MRLHIRGESKQEKTMFLGLRGMPLLRRQKGNEKMAKATKKEESKKWHKDNQHVHFSQSLKRKGR